jgi:colanic acid/amylovoran biosynthesis glycosyltransferase
MKVAFFLNDFPEVSDIFIFNQIIALIQRKHEIDIYARRIIEPNGGRHADIEHYHLLDRTYCWSVPRRPFERLAGAAARLVRWGWRNPKITLDSLNVLRHRRSALNLRTLYELLPPFEIPRQYDVIHCHYGPNGQTAVAWRDFGALRGPVITTFHGYDVNKLPRVYGSNLYKRLFNEGELFTVGSEFIKKRIITLGAPKDRVVELPMGVDLSRFRFTARIQNCDGELQLVTVARLVEVKGIEYAVTAVAKLKDKYPRLQYKIVGDGPLRAELESLSIQ